MDRSHGCQSTLAELYRHGARGQRAEHGHCRTLFGRAVLPIEKHNSPLSVHKSRDVRSKRFNHYLKSFFLLCLDSLRSLSNSSSVNGIAWRCAVDRQKHDQPWTVFMGSADGIRSPVCVAASKLSLGLSGGNPTCI